MTSITAQTLGVPDELEPGTTDKGAPKLTPCKPRTPIGSVIHAGTHAVRISNDLANRDENGKCNGELEAEDAIESGAESQAADGRKHTLPEQGIVVPAARGSIEFDGQRDTGGYSSSKAKEKTEADAVTDAEDDRVRHGPGKQSQRPMLAAQQVIRKIQTPEHIKTRARDADGGDGVVVHSSEYCRGNGGEKGALAAQRRKIAAQGERVCVTITHTLALG